MMDAILEVTDGTTIISLINPSSGFHLISWIPGIMDYKGGGIFQDPPLADYRQLRVGKWATVEENMSLHIDAANPDGSAYALQELRRLLKKANDYWTTDWQNTPVYLKAKAKCETNTRYCLIVKARLGNDRNYFQQPFTGRKATMQDLPLVLERRAWLDNVPGTGTAIAISAVESYNEHNYGNVDSSEVRSPTTTNDVFVANRRNDANITTIQQATAANIWGSALPYTIVGTGGSNVTEFGIDTSIANSGPFSSIVFDIAQPQVGGTGGVWEYWDGSAWTALTVFRDETDSFLNTGVRVFSFVQPNDWATNTPIGITDGYFIRFRYATSNATQAVIIQNFQPYTVAWPYIEIQNNIAGGDIPALVKAIVQNRHIDNQDLNVIGRIQRIVVGLRSMDRGTGFTPVLNVADEQNPSGISVALGGGTSFITDSESPTGRAAQSTTTGTKTIAFTIDETLAAQFLGSYHVWLITGTGIPTDTTFYIQYTIGSTGSTVELPPVGREAITITDNFAIDLGQLILAPTEFDDPDEIEIRINIVYSTTATVNYWQVWLMPIDEYAADFYPAGAFNIERILGNDNTGDLDSISVRKGRNSPSGIVRDTNGDVTMNLSAIANGPFIVQSGKRQRLYFLTMRRSTNPQWQIGTELMMSVQMQIMQQYFAQRGKR